MGKLVAIETIALESWSIRSVVFERSARYWTDQVINATLMNELLDLQCHLVGKSSQLFPETLSR